MYAFNLYDYPMFCLGPETFGPRLYSKPSPDLLPQRRNLCPCMGVPSRLLLLSLLTPILHHVAYVECLSTLRVCVVRI